MYCLQIGACMIQLSSDCVFSSRKGMYMGRQKIGYSAPAWSTMLDELVELIYRKKKDDYYVIVSMLPELQKTIVPSGSHLIKALSSADNLLSFEETNDLLKRHHY